MTRARSVIVLVLCGTVAGSVLAQTQERPIQWLTNRNDAVAAAQRTGDLLLIYNAGDTNFGDENDLNDAIRKTFRDPLVRRVVNRRYVPLKLARSTRNNAWMQQHGARILPMHATVMTPRGDVLGLVRPSALAMPNLMLDKLTQYYRTYRQMVYTRTIRPGLTGGNANDEQMCDLLERVRKLVVLYADQDVADLLTDNVDRSEQVRKCIYETLAYLSTRTSIRALARAAQEDDAAAAALRDAFPVAAGYVLPSLSPNNVSEKAPLYEAVVALAGIEDAKPVRYFENASADERKAALEQVKEEARRVAREWRNQEQKLR